MKKTFLAVVATIILSCVVLGGCSSKDDPIVGKWKFEGTWTYSIWINRTIDIKSDGVATVYDQNGDLIDTLVGEWSYDEETDVYEVRTTFQNDSDISTMVFTLKLTSKNRLTSVGKDISYLTRQ